MAVLTMSDYMPSRYWWGSALFAFCLTMIIVYASGGLSHASLIIDVQALLFSTLSALAVLMGGIAKHQYDLKHVPEKVFFNHTIPPETFKQYNPELNDIVQQPQVIYTGRFSEIVRLLWNEQFVAVKRLKTDVSLLDQPNSTEKPFNADEELNYEIMRVSSLRSPYILRFFGVSQISNRKHLIMEYMNNGSLDQSLSSLPIGLRQSVGLQMALGIQYLHHPLRAILHRDIKTSNVLVGEQTTNSWQVKIADFDTAIALSELSREEKMLVGTPGWMAPEIIKQQLYSKSSDVFALGVTLWEILYMTCQPFDQLEEHSNDLIANGTRPSHDINDRCAQSNKVLFDLMLTCWEESTQNRPTIDQVVQTLSLAP